jgi:hypothetical protein
VLFVTINALICKIKNKKMAEIRKKRGRWTGRQAGAEKGKEIEKQRSKRYSREDEEN